MSGALRAAGAVVATALLVAAIAALRATGWAAPARAVLVVPITLFWAGALAALLEAVVPSRRLGPTTLALLGGTALVAAETLVLS